MRAKQAVQGPAQPPRHAQHGQSPGYRGQPDRPRAAPPKAISMSHRPHSIGVLRPQRLTANGRIGSARRACPRQRVRSSACLRSRSSSSLRSLSGTGCATTSSNMALSWPRCARGSEIRGSAACLRAGRLVRLRRLRPAPLGHGALCIVANALHTSPSSANPRTRPDPATADAAVEKADLRASIVKRAVVRHVPSR